MSSASSEAREQIFFPDELVFHFFCFLNPTDVIRLRLVSKQFNDVASDVRLWRTLYHRSSLPRPPGPFAWQSIQFLERNLILSEQLSHTWTSQPLKVTSRGKVPLLRLHSDSLSRPSCNVLFGRYIIWIRGTEIMGYDHITDTSLVLWRNNRDIFSIDIPTKIFPDGQRIYVVLSIDDEAIELSMNLKLLEFSPQDDAGLSLGPVSFEIDSDLGEWVGYLFPANPLWIFIVQPNNQSLVINKQTRVVYEFPIFSSRCIVSHDFTRYSATPVGIIAMGSYVLTLHRGQTRSGRKVLYQAFVAPNPLQPLAPLSRTGTCKLRLTHEAVVDRSDAPSIIVDQLCTPVVCPKTGNTHTRSLGISYHNINLTTYMCIDITIPPASPNTTEILPMTVKTSRIFSVNALAKGVFFAVSMDGHGRGGLVVSRNDEHARDEHGENEHRTSERGNGRSSSEFLYKFTFDASGAECTAVVGKHTKLPDGGLGGESFFEVDCFTGRTFSEAGGDSDRHLAMMDIC